ncbi:MAG: transglutaminase domain-containing protein, partial [Muribaculaceae bacterium]|nr:transglutaminase domain-containing protein [Muribaculaceae bacterium]
ISDPVYYSQFSLSKIEDGNVRLLDFYDMLPLSELTASHPRFDTGQYVMTTGQRMADGSVLARTTLFTVEENGEKTIPLIVRQDNSGIQVVGSFNSEDLYQGRDGKIQNLLSTTGRGYYTLIYGKPNHEPTSHVLNDISAVAKDLEADGRKIILLYGDQGQLERAQLERFSDLPSNVVAGCDIDGNILKELEENLHLTEGDLPVVIVADTFNRVVFVSQGYAIGMGEKLMDVLRRVE